MVLSIFFFVFYLGCEGRSLFNGVLQGTVLSRNYPLPHHGNGECLWIFTHPHEDSFEINLHFTDFFTSHMDKLYVFDGIGTEKVFFGKYATI